MCGVNGGGIVPLLLAIIADLVRRCVMLSFGTALTGFVGWVPGEKDVLVCDLLGDTAGSATGVGGVTSVEGVPGRSSGNVDTRIDGFVLEADAGVWSSNFVGYVDALIGRARSPLAAAEVTEETRTSRKGPVGETDLSRGTGFVVSSRPDGPSGGCSEAGWAAPMLCNGS